MRRCGGGVVASLCPRLAPGQSAAATEHAGAAITLYRRFKGSDFCAVSPDGSRVCLYAFRHLETLVEEWSYDGGSTKKTDDVLRVVGLQTRDVIFATQLRSMVVSASFFADGHRLYAETFPLKAEGGRATVFQQAAVDLRTRELSQRLCPLGTSYIALSGSSLLGYEYDLQTARTTSLVVATLPGYKETARAPFAAAEEPDHYGRPRTFGNGMRYGYDTTPVVSAGGQSAVYGTGHHLVCRRTSDLKVLWTRLIEPEYFGAWLVAITPDAKTVAAAVIGGSSVTDREKFYIGVYDGRDGAVLAKLPLDGSGGLSISADGKLLAVPVQSPLPDGRTEPTVVIHDIASGAPIGKVSHPAVRVARLGDPASLPTGSRFTPDGKYLITTRRGDTFLWNIQR